MSEYLRTTTKGSQRKHSGWFEKRKTCRMYHDRLEKKRKNVVYKFIPIIIELMWFKTIPLWRVGYTVVIIIV